MRVVTRPSDIIPFGGLTLIKKFFYDEHLDRLVDTFFGPRGNKRECIYQMSDILLSLIQIYLSGGDHIEDITSHKRIYQTDPGALVPSSDTIRRVLRGLSEEDIHYRSSEENTFAFNTAQKINNVLILLSQRLHLLPSSGEIDIDFDHVFLETEKCDAQYGYKSVRGYFPGVVSSNGVIVYVENRDGNTPVTFNQAETLKRMFALLNKRHLCVNRFRADCGSYTKAVIQTLQDNCTVFYLRAARNADVVNHIKATTHGSRWKKVIINDKECEVQSVMYPPMGLNTSYRLVVKREPDKTAQEGLFTGKVLSYTYWCILTNDMESSEEDVISLYNQRGARERDFSSLNGDFGWKYPPFSYLKENTTFLIFTAMVKNFYTAFLRAVAPFFKDLTETSGVKRFLYSFVCVPAKWIRKSRRWQYVMFTTRPYTYLHFLRL